MKTRKIISFLTAAVMTAVSLPVLSSFAAEDTVLLGDVDQDGYITGHDSAMVSRYLNVDSSMFTDEQLMLADMNQDGIVDQTDADLIHAAEAVGIGAIDHNLNGCLRQLQLISIQYAGGSIEIVPTEDIASTEYAFTWRDHDLSVIDQAHYNLLDVDADGDVDMDDIDGLLHSYLMCMLFEDEVYGNGFYSEGRYDLYDGGYMDVPGLKTKPLSQSAVDDAISD